MKKIAATFLVLVITSFAFLSCGGYNNTNTSHGSGLKFRAFVFNPLFPGSLSPGPALNIIDATKDQLSFDRITLGGSATAPGAMVLFPNKRFTLMFSVGSTTVSTNSTIAIVDNATENVGGPNGGGGTITLPDVTQSVAVAADNLTGYAALPNATVSPNPPGTVEVLDFGSSSLIASIPVPGAQWVVASHNGNRILAFGSSANTVTVISPSLIGTTSDPRTPVTSSSFDHPVWGIFSPDDSAAYIFSCGAECGGTAASITALDMTATPPTVLWTVPVPAATFGLLAGSTLYVAGTQPPANPQTNTCAASSTATLATRCGQLTLVSLASGVGVVTGSAIITDGYHDRMAVSANGQLFIGSQTCTNINAQTPNNTSNEVRGCLSIFNTVNPGVVVPPQNGDATGLAPITGRNVMYVCQGGGFQIYDTTTDQLQTNQLETTGGILTSIVGQALDVKLVD